MTSPPPTAPFGLKEKVFLILGVPLLAFLALEGLFHALDLPSVTSPVNEKDFTFEMPTWMLADENTKEKFLRLKGNEQSIEWLNLFESARGYRVHLKPNISQKVKDTFSSLNSEKDVFYTLHANALGFRGPLPQPAEKEDASLLVFGDSSSFGWGVDYEESFSALLEDRLGQLQADTRISVANFAMPGDSSEYGRLIFEAYAPQYKPDFIILGFGANDAKLSRVSHTSQAEKFRKHRGWQSLRAMLNNSALVQTAGNLLRKATLAHATRPEEHHTQSRRQPAVTRQRYRENLREMISAAASWGGKTLVLSLCSPAHYARAARKEAQHSKAQFFNGQQFLIRHITPLQEGALLPDLTTAFEQRNEEALQQRNMFYVTSDGCHPNVLGHRLLADALAEQIVQSGLFASEMHDTF